MTRSQGASGLGSWLGQTLGRHSRAGFLLFHWNWHLTVASCAWHVWVNSWQVHGMACHFVVAILALALWRLAFLVNGVARKIRKVIRKRAFWLISIWFLICHKVFLGRSFRQWLRTILRKWKYESICFTLGTSRIPWCGSDALQKFQASLFGRNIPSNASGLKNAWRVCDKVHVWLRIASKPDSITPWKLSLSDIRNSEHQSFCEVADRAMILPAPYAESPSDFCKYLLINHCACRRSHG